MAKVVMYTTSTAATLKLKSDIRRMKELLEAKKVIYEEVSWCSFHVCIRISFEDGLL